MKEGDRYETKDSMGNTVYREYSHAEYFGAVSIWLTSLDDPTAHDEFDYDSDCSCCWLNIPHSKNYHLQKLRKSHEV